MSMYAIYIYIYRFNRYVKHNIILVLSLYIDDTLEIKNVLIASIQIFKSKYIDHKINKYTLNSLHIHETKIGMSNLYIVLIRHSYNIYIYLLQHSLVKKFNYVTLSVSQSAFKKNIINFYKARNQFVFTNICISVRFVVKFVT